MRSTRPALSAFTTSQSRGFVSFAITAPSPSSPVRQWSPTASASPKPPRLGLGHGGWGRIQHQALLLRIYARLRVNGERQVEGLEEGRLDLPPQAEAGAE